MSYRVITEGWEGRGQEEKEGERSFSAQEHASSGLRLLEQLLKVKKAIILQSSRGERTTGEQQSAHTGQYTQYNT